MPFLKQETMDTIKENLLQYAPKFMMENNEWIAEELGESPFSESKYNMTDIQLDMSEERPALTDAANVQRIYDNFRFLSDSLASDERVWAGLCLGPFWGYVQYRWGVKKDCSPANIKQHFFFAYGARRSLTRNAVSRLWWIGRLTYDKEASDPYWLTKFVCESSRYITDILERNTSNNLHILRAFLKAVMQARDEGVEINSNKLRELEKYLDLLGGIYILDCLSEDRICSRILEKAHETT